MYEYREIINALGEAEFDISYKHNSFKLIAYIVPGDKQCLIGRNWLSYLHLDWKEIYKITTVPADSLENLLKNYEHIFGQDIGTLQVYKAKIYLKDGTLSIYYKPRPVPYA